MKSILLAISLALSFPAWAAPNTAAIANMNAWCECVMFGGVCVVSNRPAAKTITSRGVVSAQVAQTFRADPLMCQRGVQACTADWNSEGCMFFTAKFRQTPMVCVRPGEPRQK